MSVRCSPVPTIASNAMIPFVVLVTVLPFRTQIGDLLLDAVRILERLATIVVSPGLGARGARPHVSGQQLQQLRFARSVRAHEHPALPGANAPVNATQHRLAGQCQADILKIDTDKPRAPARALGRQNRGIPWALLYEPSL